MSRPLSFLRPYLHPASRPTLKEGRCAYLRFYSTVYTRSQELSLQNDHSKSIDFQEDQWRQKLLKREKRCPTWLYPRSAGSRAMTRRFLDLQYGRLEPDTTANEAGIVHGRVLAYRSAGKGLTFLTVNDPTSQSIQIVCNISKITNAPNPELVRKAIGSIKKGDIYQFYGHPHRTSSGELSFLLTKSPQLLSPCLHPFISSLSNAETKIKHRHLDFWTSKEAVERIHTRASIIQCIRDYLKSFGHVEVQTPILAHEAGGAVARPFRSVATEFPSRQISLRVAPELWLKRLVLGGFHRVFEIGPCFRNEGLDLDHNPEFTTCEFYQAYANLEELISTTEKLFSIIDKVVRQHASKPTTALQEPDIESAPPFARLDFISTIETCLKQPLPDLGSPKAKDDLLTIFNRHNITVPEHPTLPRLLDKLSAEFIEPHCQAPTFIIHHPECLAPLAKSYTTPAGQQVAASAELFVKGHEIANMYEEENSPFEQRRKFEEAITYRADKPKSDEGIINSEINESYIEALEWGLPPTGGWGCGIDRLVMLFTGTNRIGDVLTFGTLRNVVNLGSAAKSAKKLPQPAQEDTKKEQSQGQTDKAQRNKQGMDLAKGKEVVSNPDSQKNKELEKLKKLRAELRRVDARITELEGQAVSTQVSGSEEIQGTQSMAQSG